MEEQRTLVRDARCHVIDDIVARMTLEQKCALLSGDTAFGTRAFPSLGVPSLLFSDGPHGVRKQAGSSDHLGLNPSVPATCFPTACTMANSWDIELGERVGEALGREAADQGVGCLLGPGLNTKRSPLCGRNFEYFSEDPYLSGKMAAAYVRGIQRSGIAACPKHFAANSQELRRMASDSVLDERTLRELYLTNFEIAVREGGPRAIMTSYNVVNGTYANESRHLLRDILRGEWGFGGAIVTDWGGSNDHVAGVNAGSTFEMPAPGGDSVRELVAAVRAGHVSEETLDARVSEALELVLGGDAAVRTASAEGKAESALDPQPASAFADHHALAREAAAQSAVLLKNEGDLLPLAPGTKVALIGDFAREARYQGAGSSAVNATRVDTLLESFKDSDLELVGFEQGFTRDGNAVLRERELIGNACALARKADVAVLCLGLTEARESEGVDRTDMCLDVSQQNLLGAVARANPHVVVLLHAGAPVETPWRTDCQALLLLGLGGQAGAAAALDLLEGRVCPSGKLAETWPERLEDTPCAMRFPSSARTAEYREGIYVGYRYYETAGVPVAFPFGFGLSYTSFSYDDLRVERDAHGMPTRVSFAVTNAGGCAAAEICQLYVAKPAHEVFRPEQELKGFARVRLAAGEARDVTIDLDDKAFRYWNVRTGSWEIEGGAYELRVCAASDDPRLVASVEVAGTGAPNPYEGIELAPYETGCVQDVDAATFERLLGHALPDAKPHVDRNLTFGELGRARSPLGWLVGATLNSMLRRSASRGEPNLNATFVHNMPLRALAKMCGGMVSMGMVDAIVMELRGFWVIGLVRCAVEFVLNQVRNVQLERDLSAADSDSGEIR